MSDAPIEEARFADPCDQRPHNRPTLIDAITKISIERIAFRERWDWRRTMPCYAQEAVHLRRVTRDKKIRDLAHLQTIDQRSMIRRRHDGPGRVRDDEPLDAFVKARGHLHRAEPAIGDAEEMRPFDA